MTDEQDPRSLSAATLADLIKSTLPEDGVPVTRTEKLLDAVARKLLAPKVAAPNVFVSRSVWDALAERVAKPEEWAHEPFDFSDLIGRLEQLERSCNITAVPRNHSLYNENEPMADGETEMTAAEDVLAWLIIEKIGVPDDRNYSPNEAREILVRRLDYATELENVVHPIRSEPVLVKTKVLVGGGERHYPSDDEIEAPVNEPPMSEADCYEIELALQHGFDPHEDGVSDGDSTYIVKAKSLVDFIKMLKAGPHELDRLDRG